MFPRIRIVCDSPLGAHTRVLLVDRDGSEQDITQALHVARIDVALTADGSVTRASLDCLAPEIDVVAAFGDITLYDPTGESEPRRLEFRP